MARIEPVTGDNLVAGSDPNDVLSRGWKVGLYGAALIPYGSWFVVLGSSILFYVWRKEHPNKAKSVNRHGWLAWLMGLAVWGAIWVFNHDSRAPALPVSEAATPLAAPVATPVAPAPRDFMAGIHQKVAKDAIDQYELTKKHGTLIERCVHAQMVGAAFLQAKDEENYVAWKAVEKADCAKAGMPQ